jgi:hypothetical protein
VGDPGGPTSISRTTPLQQAAYINSPPRFVAHPQIAITLRLIAARGTTRRFSRWTFPTCRVARTTSRDHSWGDRRVRSGVAFLVARTGPGSGVRGWRTVAASHPSWATRCGRAVPTSSMPGFRRSHPAMTAYGRTSMPPPTPDTLSRVRGRRPHGITCAGLTPVQRMQVGQKGHSVASSLGGTATETRRPKAG